MAESGAAKRSTKRAVGNRLARVQSALGRAIGHASGAGRQAQLLARFGKARSAAENVLSTKGAPAGSTR